MCLDVVFDCLNDFTTALVDRGENYNGVGRCFYFSDEFTSVLDDRDTIYKGFGLCF